MDVQWLGEGKMDTLAWQAQGLPVGCFGDEVESVAVYDSDITELPVLMLCESQLNQKVR